MGAGLRKCSLLSIPVCIAQDDQFGADLPRNRCPPAKLSHEEPVPRSTGQVQRQTDDRDRQVSHISTPVPRVSQTCGVLPEGHAIARVLCRSFVTHNTENAHLFIQSGAHGAAN